MMKKMPIALALIAGFAVAAPSTASACGACGSPGARHYTSSYSHTRNVRVATPPVARYHYTAGYRAPAPAVCAPAPVCRPVVCDPCYDPCRRSGLLGLGILGIL